jgi:hypothetical protein
MKIESQNRYHIAEHIYLHETLKWLFDNENDRQEIYPDGRANFRVRIWWHLARTVQQLKHEN